MNDSAQVRSKRRGLVVFYCWVCSVVAAIALLVYHAPTDPAAARTPSLDPLRAKLCGTDLDLAPLVVKYEGPRLYVKPAAWDRLDIVQRQGIAGWYSVCQMGGEDVFIKHGNTGRTLAIYGPGLGYHSKE